MWIKIGKMRFDKNIENYDRIKVGNIRTVNGIIYTLEKYKNNPEAKRKCD